MRLLCILGFHEWYFLGRYKRNVMQQCSHCGLTRTHNIHRVV